MFSMNSMGPPPLLTGLRRYFEVRPLLKPTKSDHSPDRDFNRLWLGQSISLFGTAVTSFAVPTLAIISLHANTFQVGWLKTLATLPFLLFGLPVGVLADRVSRRRLMIGADVLRCGAIGTIPAIAILGSLHIEALYAVTFVAGLGAVGFQVAYQAFLPEIVPRERLLNANIKLETSYSIASISGNAIGGILIQFIGVQLAIVADALSYLASIISLSGIRASEPQRDHPRLSLSLFLSELLEGLTLFSRAPDLRLILISLCSFNAGFFMILTVMLPYAYNVLHLQPGLLGITYGISEIGFLGALLAGRIAKRFGLKTTLIATLCIGTIGAGLPLLAQVGAPYFVIFFSNALDTMSIPIYNINHASYRQLRVEARLQGRMTATLRTFTWGVLPIASAAGGALGSAIGLPQTMEIGTSLCLLSVLILLPLRVHQATL